MVRRRNLCIDVEFHAALPKIVPEVVRRVHRILDPIGRASLLLELLGLHVYCDRADNRCLLWQNDVLIPLRQRMIHVQHGTSSELQYLQPMEQIM